LAKPVRAPSATPAPDSTYDVTDDTPIAPPSDAEAESTSSRRRSCGGSPSSSLRPPAVLTATAVPIVSKKSDMNSAKMSGTSDHVSASTRLSGFSASPIVSKPASPGQRATPSGPSSTPKIRPSAVVVSTPTMTAPRNPRAVSATPTKIPASAISAGPEVRLPSAMPVAGSLTTIPPSRSPTNAMKMPMPTPMDSFSELGTARTTASRRPASTSTTAIRPSITTQAMPTAQPTCWPMMMSKATSALRPRPDASASGMFATSPMTIVATPAASAVATATPVNGTPACDRIAGLTNTM